MKTKTGTFIVGNTLVTNVIKPADLWLGAFCYGNQIPVYTTITNINLSLNQIILSNPIMFTGTQTFNVTTMNPATYLETMNALADVKSITDEQGDMIKLINRNESDITRDNMNSIMSRNQNTVYFFNVYPVIYSNTVKTISKTGLMENSDIVVKTAMQDWINYGIDIDDLEFAGRSTVQFHGNDYEIVQKLPESQKSDTYLYISLGLKKK